MPPQNRFRNFHRRFPNKNFVNELYKTLRKIKFQDTETLYIDEFKVPKHLLGWVIGINGANIKQALKVEGITNIKFFNDRSKFKIFGKNEEAVKKVRRILELTEESLQVSKDFIRKIFGYRNHKINKIVNNSGVIYIKIEGDNEKEPLISCKDNEVNFVIMGTIESVSNAKHIILDKLQNLIKETKQDFYSKKEPQKTLYHNYFNTKYIYRVKDISPKCLISGINSSDFDSNGEIADENKPMDNKRKLHNDDNNTMNNNPQNSGDKNTYGMSITANKKEAYKWFHRAESLIVCKKYALAEKFILKSKNIFPLSNADKLHKRLKKILLEMNSIKNNLDSNNDIKKNDSACDSNTNYQNGNDHRSPSTFQHFNKHQYKPQNSHRNFSSENSGENSVNGVDNNNSASNGNMDGGNKKMNNNNAADDNDTKSNNSQDNNNRGTPYSSEMFKEINKDEAQTCLNRAEQYLQCGEFELALKFVTKSIKLFSLSEADTLFKKIKIFQQLAKSTKNNASSENMNDKKHNSNGNHHSNNYQFKQPSKQENDFPKHCPNVGRSYYSVPNDYMRDGNETMNNSKNVNDKNFNNTQNSFNRGATYSHKMFNEINKDESYTCLERAEKYIENKQFELAEKFVLKSKRMFSLPETDELLKRLQEIQKQIDLVQKVKNCSNYYELLDIKITASVSEIKKAYKKLALLLHPDKNCAPDSEEVFKKLQKAFEVLSDQKKRKNYNEDLRWQEAKKYMFK